MVVLGLDAAWTEKGTSGVALLSAQSGERRVVVAASSYAEFIVREGANTAQRLLRSAEARCGHAVDVVAIDMPIARLPITGRRVADDNVARAFGKYGAGTHSPGQARPGAVGRKLHQDFEREGYMIATLEANPPLTPAIIEVFPLVALVRLMRLSKRPPYKVAKARKYWPSLSGPELLQKLLDQWHAIERALSAEILQTGIEIPETADVKSRASLKPLEDRLDAVVCAWVGACYLECRAEPFGDSDAAIWVPNPLGNNAAAVTEKRVTTR